MRAYYNELDAYAAEWLRNLIRDGLIAPGDVDERSIVEVQPNDVRGYTQCHFFAGIGGWSLSLRRAGWADERPVWTGSCPCQPFSSAGQQRGTGDERHLWPQLLRLIAERRPPVVFGEQVASRLGRGWLAGVRADLEAMGYGVGAADLCAAGVGAPHIRQRLWWVADAGHSAGGRGKLGPRSTTGRDGAQDTDTARRGCEDGGLANREAGRWGEVDSQRGGRAEGSEAEGGQRPEHRGCAGGVVHAEYTGLQGRSHEDVSREGWRVERGISSCAGRITGWNGFWIPCADGKSRRIEPGIEPLAHGVSGRVAVERTRVEAGTEVQETHWYNRVGALRGFGNAIVPEVAEAFIRAYAGAGDMTSPGPSAVAPTDGGQLLIFGGAHA